MRLSDDGRARDTVVSPGPLTVFLLVTSAPPTLLTSQTCGTNTTYQRQFPFCLNYVRYHPSKPISLPVETVNEEESPAMKRGGFIAFVANKVECLVDEGVPIPESIKVRCDGLRQKDVVRRDRLVLPEGVRIHPRVAGDYLLGTVFGAKGKGGVGSAGDAAAAASADGKAE